MEIQPKDTSKGHFYVSMVKSFIRIAAGAAIIMSVFDPFHSDKFMLTAGAMLIVAEILGIIEEVV